MILSRTQLRSTGAVAVGLAITLGTTTPALASGFEFSFGIGALSAPSMIPPERLVAIPRQFQPFASYLPPVTVPSPGLAELEQAQRESRRGACIEDAARLGYAGAPGLMSQGMVYGAGLAGAAVTFHPTLVGPDSSGAVRLNPQMWPLGLSLEGVFF